MIPDHNDGIFHSLHRKPISVIISAIPIKQSFATKLIESSANGKATLNLHSSARNGDRSGIVTGPTSKLLSSAFGRGLVIGAALIVPFLIFLFSLDRYPSYYVDEPFFSEPAIRRLNGGEFLYRVSANAPHGDTVFAAHSPVLPRLQLVIFQILGVSQFTSRLADFVAGYLAIGVLVFFLARRGMWFSSIILALAWVGDRASQEVMLGRMEGLALLALSVGYIELTRFMEARTAPRALGCGLGIGLACAFHPVCVSFAGVGAVLLLFRRDETATNLSLRSRFRKTLWPLAWYSFGGMIPAALVLWLWAPHLREALVQFRWSCRNDLSQQLSGRFSELVGLLGWCRFYFVGLVTLVGSLLLPMIVGMILTGWRPKLSERSSAPWIAALAFTLAGLFSLLRSRMYPYYLIYFSVWPAMSLGILVDGLGADQRALRRIAITACVALAFCWVPSLCWNMMRARESILTHDGLDQTAFAHRLASLIPANVPVTGTPEVNLIARRAGLNFTPLGWFAEFEPVRSDTWIILNRDPRFAKRRVDPNSLRGRPVVYDGPAFPGVKYLEYPIVIYGPQPDSA